MELLIENEELSSVDIENIADGNKLNEFVENKD